MARLVAIALVAGPLLLAIVLAAAAEGTAAPSASPLKNEDIVRMVASGTPEKEILRAIEDRPEAFDLSNDMVEELRLAGVSEAVLTAMRHRHAESAPATPPPAPLRAAKDRAPLVVTLAGDRTLKVPAWADEEAKARFHLPKENEQRQVKDVAVFLACTTAEHVPDLWRSKTPLGRDMGAVVRHEMLAFVPGDTPDGKAPRVTVPATIQGDVDASDPHDIILGVAARIGDHWVQLAFATLKGVKLGPDAKTVTGRIARKGHGFDFEIALTAGR